MKNSGSYIMGYDASPDTPIISGISIQMSIDMKDEKRRKHYLKNFLKAGKSILTFKTSCGAYYGRVSDQYGIL